MPNYENLSKELTERIIHEKKTGTFTDFSFNEDNVVRRNSATHDASTVWRTAFIRDVDKIMNCPYFSRYADKTQVLSFYKNDDLTHRSLHVQLVSRIARTLGKALNLNLDLIEAIALGHDIGHTPFGHTGERILSDIYYQNTSRYFNHNIHSVRVLDKVFPLNVSLQTLDGIAAHNGELELEEYRPKKLSGFDEFDIEIEKCYLDKNYVTSLTPSTLEGCVVRISDIIAYLGKDRLDAENSSITNNSTFLDYGIGTIHAEIVNNLLVNVIENSYGKPYIKMDKKHFDALKKAKKDNYELIYKNKTVKKTNTVIEFMMKELYERLLKDFNKGDRSSPIFTHHVAYLNKPYYSSRRSIPYENNPGNDVVVDYIASMTDDYFTDLYKYLFPKDNHQIEYKGYFD